MLMLILHYCTYPWEKTPPFLKSSFSVLSSKGRGDTMIVEAMVFVVVLAVVLQLVNFVAVLMVMVAILLEILIGCAVIMVFPIKPSLIIGRNLVSQIICIKSLMVKHTITCFYSICACNSWFWFSWCTHYST